jgi:fructuronate reductase
MPQSLQPEKPTVNARTASPSSAQRDTVGATESVVEPAPVDALAPLGRDTLPAVSEKHLCSPASAWREPEIGIVHLGLGNFHRAHQALYTEEAMLVGGGDWGICGVSLTGNVEKRDVFRAQDGFYSVVQRGPDGVDVRVVRPLREVLTCPDDAGALMTRLCMPTTRIVSLTVTEKGYCRNAAGDVDLAHRDIAADLASYPAVRTVPGWLVAALARRRAAGMSPFTVLSCDNLAHNGDALQRVVVGFAAALDTALADWIAREVAFPSTMVDRIVPATTDDDVTDAARALGYRDAVPVPCEPFRQWVIEDRFPTGRPAWEKVGAALVRDVAPYELAKLRMLNAAHSALAYWSMYLDFETIDRAVVHTPLRRFIDALLTDEVIPVLRANPEIARANIDLAAYRDALLARFTNPALKHRTAQIAMDGSQKIPLRLVPTLMEAKQLNLPTSHLLRSIAVWIVFLSGMSASGRRYPIQDPMAAVLAEAIHADTTVQGTAHDVDVDAVDGLLSIRAIFPAALAGDAVFRDALIEAVGAIRRDAVLG